MVATQMYQAEAMGTAPIRLIHSRSPQRMIAQVIHMSINRWISVLKCFTVLSLHQGYDFRFQEHANHSGEECITQSLF